MAGTWQRGGNKPLLGTPLEDVVVPPSDAFPPGISGGEGGLPTPPPDQEAAPQFSGPELDVDQEPGSMAVPGTEDVMPRSLGPTLTDQQRLKVKRLQAEHDMNFARTILNPREEAEFQKAFRNSDWAKGFQAQFGSLPDPNDASYDYRGAWKQNLIPQAAGQHWPDRAPNGQWLKSPDHPSAWMEYYQDATGRDPEEDNIDAQKFNMMLHGETAQAEGVPPVRDGGGPRGGSGLDLQGPVAPPQTQVAQLFGFGGSKPAAPPKPTYTKEELEYMKGAGVTPGAPAAQPPVPPAGGGPAPSQMPAPTKRQGDIDRMLEEAEKGKGKGTLGEQWKRRGSKRQRNPVEDEVVETT